MSTVASPEETKSEEKIQVNRNFARFWVDEEEALESSLQELGKGLVLNEEIANELRQKIKEIKESKSL